MLTECDRCGPEKSHIVEIGGMCLCHNCITVLNEFRDKQIRKAENDAIEYFRKNELGYRNTHPAENCNVCGKRRRDGNIYIKKTNSYSGTPKSVYYCLKCYSPRDAEVIGLED